MRVKATHWGHRWTLGAVLIGSLIWRCLSAEPVASTSLTQLRDCVARAASPQAVAACERREQDALRQRIDFLGTAITEHLDGHDLVLFERNVAAWQAYFDSEQTLLGLTLERRVDGLGSALRQGGINRLYEQRERQLREHLHNLKRARKSLTNRP